MAWRHKTVGVELQRRHRISKSPFRKSPLPFVRAVFAMRRRGQCFRQTHLDGIVSSRALKRDAFSKGGLSLKAGPVFVCASTIHLSNVLSVLLELALACLSHEPFNVHHERVWEPCPH
jgi:hypothetical protein